MLKRFIVVLAAVAVFAGGAMAAEHKHGEDPGMSDHMSHVLADGAKGDFTLMQIMHDLALQINRIQFGIFTNNRLMIEEGARGITSHPAPKGGLKPYLKKNVDDIKAMAPSIDQDVHKAAMELADAAKTSTMLDIQERTNSIAKACVGCHEMFRN